jgi:uncharacterized protein YndB with AHSA1/START domain
MPRNKDLKRLVRARMQKTGEAYTAARAQILKKSNSNHVVADARAPAPTMLKVPTPKDYPALAGMSDDAVKERTGCTWERWVYALDRVGADQLSHREIARVVREKYKVDSWWSQTVTVGYERIKGLRARGQGRDGSFGATKSRTYNVAVDTLFAAWNDARVRRRWLDGATTKVRTATAPKSLRLDWANGPDRGIIAVGFTAKGPAKSAVALEHARLPDRETAARLKQYWSDRLAALADVLSAH